MIVKKEYFSESFDERLIRENEEMLNEGLFDKKQAPEEFTKFALDFYKKINKKKKLKIDIKGRTFEDVIKEKKSLYYRFTIDDPRVDFFADYAKSFAKNAAIGAIGGTAIAAGAPSLGYSIALTGFGVNTGKQMVNSYKETKELEKLIVSCGIKDKPRGKNYNDNFDSTKTILSKSKNYIYIAWPIVVSEDGKTLGCYDICLKCVENNEKNKKYLAVDESATSVPNEREAFTRYFDIDEEDIGHSLTDLTDDPEKEFYRHPVFNKAVNEHFNVCDKRTHRTLLSLDEAGQNSVVMSLTSKLYDKIVEKCDDIDYGEIPATKGDITKLSKYDSMKETISIMHDLLKEYKQDTGPVDELSVAFSNVEARKDLFERAYRYNSELPISMYCNVVLGIITGISYMIATCIEFIKDPGTENFRISLDKISYAKTKDHMIYNTLKSFNKTCANKEFDKAMEAVLKSSTKNFGGAVIAGGIAIGILGTILVLIPVLRELIFMFYYMRMKVSDFFDIQADLLQVNAYNIEANSTLSKSEQKKVMAKQLKCVERFRKISNTFAIDVKKAEVAADKEKKSDDETKMLIDDIDGIDTGSNGSALF